MNGNQPSAVSSGVPCLLTRDSEELLMSIGVSISLTSKKNGLKEELEFDEL